MAGSTETFSIKLVLRTIPPFKEGSGGRTSSRVGNYSKPRVLKERGTSDLVVLDEREAKSATDMAGSQTFV
ncbi:MAG: hypothetical protein NTW11_03065 [Candidatus Staskawiczbacteria bacterium]|nr:hypothetical protein [Candidatus Staskawiczbacteria bacterium]